MPRFLLMSALVALSSIAVAQQGKVIPAKGASLGDKSAVSMERYPGGSVVTDMGYSYKVNATSSLKREWFVVRDESSPATVEGPAGIDVTYKQGQQYSLGQFQYHAAYTIRAKEPISAFELRIHVFDVFGKLIKTLSATELADLPDTRGFDGTWRIFSENEASEAYASVTYIAQVRTASGRVYEIDRAAVFEQVRKVGRKITEADLEPKKEAPAPAK